MAIIRIAKTSFAGGEIAPQLLGRGDLRAYENGALTLRNMFIHPTGGVSRRSGLRFVDAARGPGRLVAFEFNTEQTYLLLFTDRLLTVYRNGGRLTELEVPWSEAQVPHISWTQSADTLLVVHPNVPPKRITRTADNLWTVSDWLFVDQDGRVQSPHFRFGDEQVTLRPSATTGTITVTASAAVFDPGHQGVRLRLAGKEVQITAVTSSSVVQARIIETLANTTATADWSEEALSMVRGWPVSACFHQDRLVIGGSRDLPNRLWLSKSGDLFNFDLGEGLDDEGIEFSILSDQLNAVRHVFSGRHLQVFTSGAEWMVAGNPLTPTSIQLHRQTRVGSRTDRSVQPRDVDGATVFVPRSGPQLREFLFADTEQAYQSMDLAVLAHHLFDKPVDMDLDKAGRLLHLAMSNGTLATLTIYRDEDVSAWTLQETAGSFQAIAAVGGDIYVLVERTNGYCVEVFDDTFHVDSGLSGESTEPRLTWTGLDHLEGETVKVIADGAIQEDTVVEAGSVAVSPPARSVQVGLGFRHVIEPLPSPFGGSTAGAVYRPVSVTLRLLDTAAVYLDTGRGLRAVPFKRFGRGFFDAPSPRYSGDATVRTFGWSADGTRPIWRIEQDTPAPFTLLAVSTELSVNG